MATTELEAASLRPRDIAEQRFTLGKRGYEAEEVHRFLQAVAEYVGRLQGQIEWQRARVEHLEQRSLVAQDSAYDRISREFMEVVRRADEAAGHLRSRAEDEARVALNSAREEANRIMASAAEEAERVLLTARAEAERLVAEATRQVERLVHDAAARLPAPRPPSAQPLGGRLPDTESRDEHLASDLPGPAFADFEELNLEFEGSMFDLLGETGL